MATTGASGAARTQHTQRASTSNGAQKTQEDKDTKALKTLLSLVFTVALAGNHSATANTAARYASVAGQTILLMQAGDKDSPYIDPHLRSSQDHISSFAEKLAEGVTDLLSEEKSKQEPPKPTSLEERNQEIKDLRQELENKDSKLMGEFQDFANDRGIKTKSLDKADKKQARKQRAKDFDGALHELSQEKKALSSSLIGALTDKDEDAVVQIKKDIARHDIKQKVYDAVPQEQRNKKGVLQRTREVASGIEEQLAFIDRAKEPSTEKTSFFSFLKRKQAVETPTTRQEAIAVADQNIRDLRESAFELSGDGQFTKMLNSYTKEA